MKVLEKVIEKRLRKETTVSKNQFGFKQEREVNNKINILWEIINRNV